MRVITESVRGITIHRPKGMPLAYMNKVLEHLAYDRCIKDWSYVGGEVDRTRVVCSRATGSSSRRAS